MAWTGLAFFFAAMGFAGAATVPLFNGFRAPERRWSPMGCWWILAAIGCLWVFAWCFWHAGDGQPDEQGHVYSQWDEGTMNSVVADDGTRGTGTSNEGMGEGP